MLLCVHTAPHTYTLTLLLSLHTTAVTVTALMQENEIDMDAMRLMGAADFVEIGIPKGPAVKIAYCLQGGRPPPGAALSSEITTRKFLTALGLTKVRY
jgi:SAM domain (Sterile alpha motif)